MYRDLAGQPGYRAVAMVYCLARSAQLALLISVECVRLMRIDLDFAIVFAAEVLAVAVGVAAAEADAVPFVVQEGVRS